MEGYRQIERDFTSSRAPEYHKADSSLSIKGPRLVRIGQQRKIAGRKPTPIWIDFTVKSKESNMSVSDSLFCFASNKIDFHPCPNCRAPMLVRIKSAGSDLSVRTFECFNCDNVVVMPDHHSEISL